MDIFNFSAMTKKKRLKKIRNVLLEMGAGRFFYRIERSSKSDTVEALISVINMMGEEIEEALVHQGYVNANETIRHIVSMQFILDNVGKVVAVNDGVGDLLFYSREALVGQALVKFLKKGSVTKWEKQWGFIMGDQARELSFQLIFRTKKGLMLPGACYLNKLEGCIFDGTYFSLIVVKHSKKQVELEADLKEGVLHRVDTTEQVEGNALAPKRKKVRLTQEDIRMIADARSLMLNDLARDFRPLKEFALQLGTNTFKLKYGFKELYGISVYRFLRNERLRKAKGLVQYDDKPFKSIAQICGFKSVPHFSRIFKKEFGLTPTELRQKTFLGDT